MEFFAKAALVVFAGPKSGVRALGGVGDRGDSPNLGRRVSFFAAAPAFLGEGFFAAPAFFGVSSALGDGALGDGAGDAALGDAARETTAELGFDAALDAGAEPAREFGAEPTRLRGGLARPPEDLEDCPPNDDCAPNDDCTCGLGLLSRLDWDFAALAGLDPVLSGTPMISESKKASCDSASKPGIPSEPTEP